MDLYEELVHGPGYAVCPIENMQLFKKLRDSFVEKINISTESEKNIIIETNSEMRLDIVRDMLEKRAIRRQYL